MGGFRRITIRKVLFIVMILTFTLFLASCNKAETVDNAGKLPGKKIAKTQKGEILTIKDEEKLIQIMVAEGQPFIKFNRQKWNEIYDMDNLTAHFNDYKMQVDENELTVDTVADKVINGCILEIESLDYYKTFGFSDRSVFLLMDDGTVEWFLAPPRIIDENFETWNGIYTQSQKLPWIKDIVAIYIDTEDEGYGNKTVFAEDKKGLHYDLRIPSEFYYSLGSHWEYYYDEESNALCTINFEENGYFELNIGSTYEISEIYVGTYDISLDTESSKGYRAGMIRVDLQWDESRNSYVHWEHPETIQGTFFVENQAGNRLVLFAGEGDTLVPGVDFYEFTLY